MKWIDVPLKGLTLGMKRPWYVVFGTDKDVGHFRQEPGDHEWPDEELTNGIAHIIIEYHGDAAVQPLVSIWGADLEACKRAYQHAWERGVSKELFQ